MPAKAIVQENRFNTALSLPFELRRIDFSSAMQDVYDYLYDVNLMFVERGLPRLEETLRAANMSGMISDMLTASIAKHSRSLCQNRYHNGHPDLIVRGEYPNDAVQAGDRGVEIKSTRKRGGAVDTHGGRDQWMCVFVYRVDSVTEPARERRATEFSEAYISRVRAVDFRRNDRSELGTRTATLDRQGIAGLRLNWLYRLEDA